MRLFHLTIAAVLSIAATLSLRAADGEIEGLHLGEPITGQRLNEKKLQGRVVLVTFWSLHSGPSRASIPNLIRWHDELSDFGLTIIGMHDDSAKAAEIKARSRKLNIPFPVTRGGSLDDSKPGALPHCVLFDHKAKVVARGGPAEIEKRLRSAVGVALVEAANIGASPAPLQAIIDGLKKGQAPAAAVQKLAPLQKSNDALTATKAKTLLTSILEGAEKQFDVVIELAEENPIVAYAAAQRVAATFKGLPLAKKADGLLNRIRTGADLQAELNARPLLDKIRKLDDQLAAKAGKLDPQSADFKRLHAAQLRQMATTLKTMQSSYPDAPATNEAEEICRRYGIGEK